MTEPLLGVREAARELGVNPSTVSRQLRAGILPNRGSERAPKVCLSEARAARERNLDQSKRRGPEAPLFKASAEAIDEAEGEPAPRPAAGGLDFNTVRTAREGYQAKIAQLDLEERLGNLLDRAETVDAFFTLAATLREIMERRAPELAASLDGVVDLNARIALVLGSDRKLLQTVADEFSRRFVNTADAAA